MIYEIHCSELGMDCEFFHRSEDSEEFIETVQKHARETHDVDLPRDEIIERMHGGPSL